jgi:glucokinase-like ROK family protein
MDQILSKTFSLVSKAIDTCEENQTNILGLGLSVPGTVDTEQGMLIYAPNLQWKNVPLRKIFSERTGLKVFVENDANAAAIAEHLFGMARQIKDFIFVFAGVGIGGGLFLNGELYRGNVGYAGEIGHSPIVADFPPLTCHCGNYGCWETFANQASILYRMQTYLDGKQNSIISELITKQKSTLSVPIIKQAADLNDESAILSFTKAGAAMGQGFAGLINTFNPEKIILGGPLAGAGKYLVPAIEKNMVKHSLNESGSQVQVLLSSFGADASLIGAIAIVADDILSNPMQIERR